MVVLEEGSMLTTGHNQYLQPDYLSPLPTTVSTLRRLLYSLFKFSNLFYFVGFGQKVRRENEFLTKVGINMETIKAPEPRYFFPIIFHDFLQ